jgi:hypothetical protein
MVLQKVSHLFICLFLFVCQITTSAQVGSIAHRENDGIDERLKIDLYFYNPDSVTTTLADATLARYNNIYTRAVTSEDAGKIDNIDENVAILREGKKLTIEKRPLIDDVDTIYLTIYSMKLRRYRFEIVPFHFTAPLLSAYIEDAYLQKRFPVSLADTTALNFSVTLDPGSYNVERFKIVYRLNRHYRSTSSGNWHDSTSWQNSADSVNWAIADIIPNDAARSIVIRNGHSILARENTVIDKTVVQENGALSVAEGARIKVLNAGLLLQSKENSSAQIGESGGQITGDVIVERFVPARRAWRLVTVPFSSSKKISETWQEFNKNIPGYGTHITGGASEKGFDQSPTNVSSLKYHNAANNTLDPVDSTFGPITDKSGYMLFVRGDRTVNLGQGGSAAATTTVLRATGTLKVGTQPALPVVANKFTLIGNPYASPVNFASFKRDNVPARFYMWDPKRNTVGAYVMLDSIENYAPYPPGGSYTSPSSIIQSGQAFFVEGSSTEGSVIIEEKDKSTLQANVFKTTATDMKMQVNMSFYNSDSSTTLADATVSRYNTTYSAAVTSEDAGKLDNVDENIALARDNRLLTVERRPLINATDTMFLKVYNMKLRNYKFDIVPDNLNINGLSAVLYDNYLKTSTPLSLASPSVIRFSITNTPGSYEPFRFRIIFKAGGVLPVEFKTVEAFRKEGGIQVEWKVASEKNVKSYTVEKSGDGQQFEDAAIVDAKVFSTEQLPYTWFDLKPFQGNNYYRIKSTGKDGNISFSNIALVRPGEATETITVYPNPVKNHQFTIQFRNNEIENYSVKLINNAGQILFFKVLPQVAVNASYSIKLSSTLQKGVYTALIKGREATFTERIVIE